MSQPKILSDFGLTEERVGKPFDQLSTQDLKNKSILSANQLRAELAQSNRASERLKTKIWYYTKELDNPNLLKAISELGYPIESKIAASN